MDSEIKMYLSDKIEFPNSIEATPEGIIAIGGDLSMPRLLKAYSLGIFAWYNEGAEILWWAPDPRFILYVGDLNISKSMRKVMRSAHFEVTYDMCFEEVIRHCKKDVRKSQDGTWITDAMEDAYISLHKLGYGHSVEVWEGEELVGGLYGVSIGCMFYGESMFTKTTNASKFGFISLVQALDKKGFTIIDCQIYTDHLASLGGVHIGRGEFERLISTQIDKWAYIGKWTQWLKE